MHWYPSQGLPLLGSIMVAFPKEVENMCDNGSKADTMNYDHAGISLPRGCSGALPGAEAILNRFNPFAHSD